MKVAALKYSMSPEYSTWNWKIPGYELIAGSGERKTGVGDNSCYADKAGLASELWKAEGTEQ